MARDDLTVKFNLDDSGFKNGVKRAGRAIGNFRKEISGKLGVALTGLFSTQLIKNIIGLGVSAAETADKFNAVFGPAADAMNARLMELQKTIPASRKEMQEALAVFGQMAQSFGLNSTAAQEFSVNMVSIAGDLASFNDMEPEEIFTKLRAAITGEFEPLKQLGIMIDAAKMKQEAHNLGIWDGVGALGASQKAMAIQSLIVNQMGAASGNAAITATSAANQIKFLQRNLRDLAADIGTTSLPAIMSLVEGLGWFLEKTQELTSFAGSQAGQMIYGPTDETLKRQEEARQKFKAIRQATRELTAEGELYKQGILEGTLWTEGLSEKLEGNKVKIEARTAAILEGLRKEAAASVELKDGIVEGEAEIKKGKEGISDTQKEINAANESLAESIRAQVKAQGKFAAQQKLIAESAKEASAKKEIDGARQEKLKSMKLAALKAEARGELELAQAMNSRIELAERMLRIMRDTGATKKEAAIIAKKQLEDGLSGEGNKGGRSDKSSTPQRGKISTGKIGDFGAKLGRTPTMAEREAAAGLNLAGNDTMSGRASKGASGKAAEGNIAEQGKQQTEHLKSINDTISKLNSALGTE